MKGTSGSKYSDATPFQTQGVALVCHALSGLVLMRVIRTQGVALGWYIAPFQG